MSQAHLLLNEEQRLRALYDCQILDSPPEEDFDSLTELAAQICETPVALISLVDRDRQWFKSKIGLGVQQTPRSQAFCAHAIDGSDMMVVSDALLDDRFKNNALVNGEPFIRFYAGVPLKIEDNNQVGTLCVIDQKPRVLSEFQIKALYSLARQVVSQIELRKKTKLLSDLNSQLIQQQEKMIFSAKMSSLGEMAAGIAHEINNPLSVIVGKVSILNKNILEKKIETPDLIKGLEVIERTTLRISKIVKSLRSFAHHEKDEIPMSIKLGQIISDTLDLAGEKIKHSGITVKISGDQNLVVKCRPIQISQCFLNLLNNSFDVLKDLKSAWIDIQILQEDEYCKIKFVDSGPKIPIEVQKKLMTPFFSTKPIGHGTGLGLSISRGLVESNGGELYFDDQAENTTFVIKLKKGTVSQE